MTDLNTNQRRFVAAMLTHRTVTEAAAVAGIGERTARAYMVDPDVRHELAMEQDRILAEVSQEAVGRMSVALGVLVDLATNEAIQAAVRLGAAKALLDAGRGLHEDHALLARLTAVEKQLEAMSEGDN